MPRQSNKHRALAAIHFSASKGKPAATRNPGAEQSRSRVTRSKLCSAPAKHPPRDNRPKLTIDDARAIRKRREQGETLQSLADAFGVVLGTIDHICRGRTFKSLGGRIVVRVTRPRGPNRWGKRYSKCCPMLGSDSSSGPRDERLLR